MRTALGFRPHSGWTAVVAVAGQDGRPVALVSRRIELSTPDVPVQAYHAAAGLSPDAAAELVARAHAVALACARDGLDALAGELEAAGHEVVAAGVPIGGLAIPAELATILRSHPLLHAAEGDLFREVIAAAAQERGLRVAEIPARELPALAGRSLAVEEPGLRAVLADAGREVGRPWRKDQKDAAMLGWLALASV
jgi:hypothetical protein